MGANAILLDYQARVIGLHSAAAQLRVSQTIALAAMGAALVAAGILLFFALEKRVLPAVYALGPVGLAVYAGRLAKRRHTALTQTLRLESYYERAVERMEGRWAALGARGEEFISSEHDSRRDLNVFGEDWLFELLCTCRSDVGRRHLSSYLVEMPSREGSVDG
jgi:hypothetical protein